MIAPLGRCPRLVLPRPLALGIALSSFPGALPQAGIARAVGPPNRIILLFLGRCPRLVVRGPLALGIALSSFSWGVAPGWYRPGRWPSESHYHPFPGALPQAGIGRAVGPPNRIMIAPLGRCPRLVWPGPLALGFTFDRFLGRCPRLVLRGPLALVLG